MKTKLQFARCTIAILLLLAISCTDESPDEDNENSNTANNSVNNTTNNAANNSVNNSTNNSVNNATNNSVNNAANNATNNSINNANNNAANNNQNNNNVLPAASTAYYYGRVTITSPDGGQIFQEHHTLIRRDVIPEEARIIEDVFQDSDPEVKNFPTTLNRIGDTDRFEATDDAGTFTGFLEYSGDEWAWNAWTYNITLTDGSGTLVGTGSLDNEGVHTEKIFQGPDGEVQVLIFEDGAPVTQDFFEARKQLTPPWPDE